jgi:hypothetical protein
MFFLWGGLVILALIRVTYQFANNVKKNEIYNRVNKAWSLNMVSFLFS